MGYPTKLPCIQRRDSQQFYINFHTPLAHALELQKDEQFEWTIVDKDHLVLSRPLVPPPRSRSKTNFPPPKPERPPGTPSPPPPSPPATPPMPWVNSSPRAAIPSRACIPARNRQQQDWSADYRCYSHGRVQP